MKKHTVRTNIELDVDLLAEAPADGNSHQTDPRS